MRLARLGTATLALTGIALASLGFQAIDRPSELDRLAAAHAAEHGIVQLARVHAPTAERVELLGDHFDLTEHGHDGWYDVVLYPGDDVLLDAFGFDEVEVLIDDLVRFDLSNRLLERDLAANPQKSPTDLQPGERLHGYRLLMDFEADLRMLADEYSDVARLIEFPHQTHEGRTVHGIQIADDPDRALVDGRPTSVVVGLHHAREWPSAELTIMWAYDVLESYAAGDQTFVDLLGDVNLVIVPVVNPDGYVRSRESFYDSVVPGSGWAAFVGEFAYHRKNMRPHPTPIVFQGVDPNRNYPWNWGGGGTSSSTSGDTYRGPAPGSEPEVQNVLDLLRSQVVTTLITNHTYGEMVLRPFGDTHDATPDEEILKGHADAMAAINGYRSIKGIELYVTTGTTDDWVYGVTGAPSFTFEIGENGIALQANTVPVRCQGFHPAYQLCVGDLYAENRDAFLLNAQQAANPDWHGRLVGTAPPGTTLAIEKFVDVPTIGRHDGPSVLVEHLTYEMFVGDDGSFEWWVNPSPTPTSMLALAERIIDEDELETYTLTATLPDGTVVTVDDVLVHRGDVLEFTF